MLSSLNPTSPVRYGAAFASTANLLTATNEVAVAPGANVRGIILWSASILTAQGTAGQTAIGQLIAKSSAPASGADGDVLLQTGGYTMSAAGNVVPPVANLQRPLFIAAGKGLYFRNDGSATEVIAHRSLLYTVL